MLGCSAGGHLAASYCLFWKKPFIAEALGIDAQDAEKVLKPNGMLLCYPVITSGEFAHRGSFVNLLGDRQEELNWHTFTDGAVPVENSLMLAAALHMSRIVLRGFL